MPVPSNTPALTLGRTLFDKRKFRADTDPAVIDCLAMLSMERAGAGWSGPAKGDDITYMAVYAQEDGMGAHTLWGGNPSDPVNPYPIIVSASGSATVNWQEEGVLVVSSGTVNFVGSAVTVTDVAGVATVTITTGAGTVSEAFKTIAVSGQSDVVADSATDTLTLVAGPGHTIETTAGTDTITHKADVHDASHVGLVDPTTGDDSTANDAQIGILWHEIENFDNGRNQLHGHVADDPSKPKVTCKTTEDWLELLESYDSSKSMVVFNDSTNAGTEGDERVRWVESPQKVIWGLDPDGGHTITTTGTTLTLTLKVTKYTFDAVNFVSAVDQDVTVTYEGTECP
jgi:hypothetical protein